MKKLAFLITSLLALSTLCAAGCNETSTGQSSKEAPKTYNAVEEEPDNDCKDNDCKDNDCKDKKPDFRFVQPERPDMPPRAPHKRHGGHRPEPIVKPEQPDAN